MRKPEQLFWDRIKRTNEKLGHEVLFERVENGVGSGRPDLDSLCSGNFIPIELKSVVAAPAKATTAVLGKKGLNVQQKNWHHEWAKHKGKSLIAISIGSFTVIALRGVFGDRVNSMTLQELQLEAAFTGNTEGFIKFLITESQNENSRHGASAGSPQERARQKLLRVLHGAGDWENVDNSR